MQRVLFNIALIMLFIFNSCSTKKESIKLGLAINLSGRGGLAGEYIRDGALLAVREINEQGGIRGQRIELIIRDDQNTRQGVLRADEELIRENVIAILGHSTSQNTLYAYPFVTQKNVLLITPYAATTQLSDSNDLFIRTCVDNQLNGKAVSWQLKQDHIQRIAFLEDYVNQGFVQDYSRQCIKNFNGAASEFTFNSKHTTNWDSLISAILSSEPDAVFFLTEVTMTSLAAQKLRTAGFKGKFYGSIWCQTPDLIKFGAQAVEGMQIITFINSEYTTPKMQAFKSHFENTFQRPISARAVRAYEAIKILSAALKKCKTVNTQCLKQQLLKNTFSTVMGSVQFNPFGDVKRPIYNILIQNGHFVSHNKIEL